MLIWLDLILTLPQNIKFMEEWHELIRTGQPTGQMGKGEGDR